MILPTFATVQSLVDVPTTMIQDDLWNTGHDWILETIVDARSHRLRVKIRRNFYDEQSYGLVEAWSGSEWKQVVRRPIAVMHTLAVRASNYPVEHDGPGKKVDPFLFAKDAADLIGSALLVLEGA